MKHSNTMKTINFKISDEAYKILVNYKLDNKFKKLEEALDKLIKESKIKIT